MFEIEKKFTIDKSLSKRLTTLSKGKVGLAQWYIDSKRVRLIVSKDKIDWEVETKIDVNGEVREENTLSDFKIDKNILFKYPVVIKLRYYLDDNKKISIDKHIFPKIDNDILEIELEQGETELYFKSRNKERIFKGKVLHLGINWKELKKHEKTTDKRYYNSYMAKVLKNTDLNFTTDQIEKKLYKILQDIYSG